MIASAAGPDAALLRWANAIPAVRCAAPAFRAWTGANDANAVAVTPVAAERFAAASFSGDVVGRLTVVAGGGEAETYRLGRVPAVSAVVLFAGSAAQEDSFTAVIADASAPPRTVATLAAGPRAHGLGIGSARADVQRALGAGRAKTVCGFDVVRYQPVPAGASVAEMWFFYRNGRVVALARYEAV
jgi:hypothetical protein